MPLRRRLLLSMVIPAMLLCMVGAIGVLSLRYLERASGRILSDNYRSIQDARRMARSLLLFASLEPGAAADGREAASRQAAATEFEDALRGCEANITESGELETLRAIRASWQQLRPELAALAPPVLGPSRRQALRSIHEDIEKLVAYNEKAMFADERGTRAIARGMLVGVSLSALAALAALASFALISANRISRPLADVADRLHRALNPTSLPTSSHPEGSADEIALLRDELDALLLRLAHYDDEQTRKLSHVQGRLAFVMNEVLEGLVLIDTDHRILAANRVGRMAVGMPEGEGLRLEELHPREDVRTLLVPVMEGRLQAEQDLGEVRLELDGTERIFRPRLLPVPAAAGGLPEYLILFWDVTEQRRFEESRRRFISMLSHQLKTPMTSLAMSVNLLKERLGGPASPQAELLSIATDSCSSLSALVSDLVDAARESTPDLTLKPQRVDLVRLLRSALRPLRHQAEEKGVELVMPAEGTSVHANVDPVKFPWVVTNITGNALRYTARGGRIEISLRVLKGDVEVSVTDTGTGIAPGNLRRIFEPYVSLDQEPRFGSHGLGLAIAKEIVEVHGGRIEADSVEGRGTTFVIRVPSREGQP